MYHESGLTVIPLKPRSKEPAIKSWGYLQAEPQTRAEVLKLFPDDDRNIGILGGECSGNLALLDFDDSDTFDLLVEANPRFAKLVQETSTVDTARGNHVYLRTPVPVRSSKITGLDLDVKATGGYVVAPPSIHPSGQVYRWKRGALSNIIELTALDELGFIVLEPTNLESTPSYGIGWNKFKILTGDTSGYPSRSEADAALVLTCVKNGWDYDRILHLYLTHATMGTKFREKGTKGEDYLYLTYKSALEHYKTHRRPIDKMFDEWVAALPSLEFNTRTQSTDRAVFGVVLQIARRTGKRELTLSQREVGELAGVDGSTAGRALQRISYLEKVAPAAFNKGATYRIKMVSHIAPFLHISSLDEGLKQFETNHDVWRTSGFGKNGLQLVKTMGRETGQRRSVADWGKLAGLSRSTADRKLKHMHDKGLISKEGSTYFLDSVPTKEKLDEITLRLVSNGEGDRQKRRHASERRAYRRWSGKPSTGMRSDLVKQADNKIPIVKQWKNNRLGNRSSYLGQPGVVSKRFRKN